jgi:hypothetical protein
MSSEVELCNLALSNIRAGSINSLTESSLPAQICSLKYALMRDRCLREGWQFNRKIKALASVDVDIFNWSNAYSYPIDCLKVNRLIGEYEAITGDHDVISRMLDSQVMPIGNLRSQIPYEVFNYNDNKVIGCNSSDIRVDYFAKVTDPNLFSDDFIIAFSHLLSSEIAIPIVGGDLGRGYRSDELQLYVEYLNSAKADDQNDRYLEPVESEFVTVRR